MSSYLAFDMMLQSQLADRRSRRRRIRRTTKNAFEMSDWKFVKTYRLSKLLMRNLINELQPYLPPTLRNDAITAEEKVLIAVAFFATGSYQTLTGQCKMHNVSQPTVSRAIKQVAAALNEPQILHKYIKFPLNRTGRELLKRQFYTKFQIPGVVGCIDGTHIALIKPAQNEERFINRKGYHSLNVQIICDSNLQILSVDSSYPGSTHDSIIIWSNHPLNDYFQRQLASGEFFYLLGDSGYPLRATMMTPILNAEPGTPEEHYYKLHVTARNVVERCIGVLKARFRCLLSARELHYDPASAARIVNSCAVLHNMSNTARLRYQPLSLEEVRLEANQAVNLGEASNNENRQSHNQPLQQGRTVQQELVVRLWAEKQRS